MTLSLFVASCQTAVFDPRACPVEASYTRAEQKAAADALPRADPIIQRMVVDYGKLRDKARACRGTPRQGIREGGE
jgi:hypothetical protein